MDRRDFLQVGVRGALATVAVASTGSESWASTAALPTDIWRWSATDMAAQIRQGTVSSREVVESCLGRIAQVNPALNAVIHLESDEARKAADAADAALRKGMASGPLHGVPVTIKVNVDVKGDATTNGVPANRDKVASEDSPVVTNLRNAGAVIIGRTNTPEFSFRWFTENALYGRTINPWRSDITPGGSSGGAASSIASGMCPLGHGNDIAGSIRYPAYACGIAGLRPTAGRVPSYTATAGEARPFSAQVMAVQGPLARNMRDIRLGLQAMSAGDPRDPTWVAAPLTWPTTRAPIRVALVDEIEGATVAPEVRAALAQAARWLEQEGYVVEHAALPQMREVQDVWMSIAMTDVRMGMLSAVDKFGDDAIKNAVHGMLDNAPVLDLNGYMQAIARRDALRRKWSVFLAQYPLILMPTSCQLPFQWGLDQQGPAVMKQILAAQSPMMAIAALSLPGLNVPTGLVGNVPVGVQLVAGSFREDLCITAGEAIERRAAMPKSYERPSAA